MHDEHHGWLHPFLYIFVAVYAIEFCLRMWATKKAFFRGFYNLFDALILGTGLAEIVLIFFGESISFLRALRLCRLCRVLRLAKVVRLMAVCQDLYIIFKTLSSSVYSLAWSMMFVFLCIFGSGLVLCEIVGEVLEERSHDPAALAWAYEHFGTTTRTVYSLFEATFTAKWTALARPMISDLHWLFSIYWVLFVVIVNFAIIRVVSAMFLKQALSIARIEEERMSTVKIKEKQRVTQMLREVFLMGDESKDGVISRSEFQKMVEDERVLGLFAELDIEVEEAELLFTLLSEDDGEADYEEFLAGAMKMKTNARTIDTIEILHQMRVLEEKMHQGFNTVPPPGQAASTTMADPSKRSAPASIPAEFETPTSASALKTTL